MKDTVDNKDKLPFAKWDFHLPLMPFKLAVVSRCFMMKVTALLDIQDICATPCLH